MAMIGKNYFFGLADVPEFVLDNLDTLGFKSEKQQIVRIIKLARKLGIKPNYHAVRDTIEGYCIPQQNIYNLIARYYHWQLWED